MMKKYRGRLAPLLAVLMILTAAIIFAGCAATSLTLDRLKMTAEKPQGAIKMLNGDTLKMKVFLENQLIIDELTNRRTNVTANYNAVMISGYSIYDIPAKGGFSYLDAESGKVCAVWKTCEPKYLDSPETRNTSGTPGTATVLNLDSGASGAVQYYQGMVFKCTSGVNNGKYNICTSYNNATKQATFTKPWPSGAPNPGDVFTVGGSDLLEAADITGRSDPTYIFGIKLGSNNMITKYNLQCRIYYPMSASLDFNEKAIFCFIEFKPESGGGNSTNTDIQFYNCIIKLGLGIWIFESFTFVNTKVEHTAGINTDRFNNPDRIENCIFDGYTKYFAFNSDFTFRNCYFYIWMSAMEFTGNNYNIHFDNSYFHSLSGAVNVSFITMKANRTVNLYCNAAVNFSGTIEYYQIRVIGSALGFVEMNKAINWSLIDWNTFVELTAEYDPEYVADTTLLGKGADVVNYTMQFTSAEVPDELKYFGPGYVNVVQREDYEYDILVNQKYIKNFALYSDSGCTVSFPFQSDENFYILAEDGNGIKAVFCWYGNRLFPTILTEIWDDTVYTIKHIFQIWRQISKSGISEYYQDPDTKKGISNGILEGEVKFKNIDFEYLPY